MHTFHLLPFLAILGLKNVTSWLKIFWLWFGGEMAIFFLIAVNIGVGVILYFTLSYHNALRQRLALLETAIQEQAAFWTELKKQFPTHKTIIRAEDILKQNND
jgi:hypothetical protein